MKSLLIFALLLIPMELGAQTFAKPAVLLSDGRIQAVVSMPDGTLQVFTGISGADITGQVKAQLDRRTSAVNDIKAFTAGAPVPLPDAPAPPVVTTIPPTPPLAASQQFFLDLAQVLRVKAGLLAIGIDPTSVKAYTDLLAKAAGEFQSSYVTQTGWPVGVP